MCIRDSNQNFVKAILKTRNCDIENVDSFKFKLIPIEEGIGQESSKDTWMKNTKLKSNKIEELKSYEDAIWLMSAGDSKYPLWVNMTKINETDIQLQFSQRFRNIKTSQNQETGHPPFKVNYKIENLVEKTNSLKELLIQKGRIKEIQESNLNLTIIPEELIIYFLVDWSGPERLARHKVFNAIEKIDNEIVIYFIDGTDQNFDFIEQVSKRLGEDLKIQYAGGHGTISFLRESEILDEIKFPHTLEETKIENTLNKWIKTIDNKRR